MTAAKLSSDEIELWAGQGIPPDRMTAAEFRRRCADMALAHLAEPQQSAPNNPQWPKDYERCPKCRASFLLC